MTLDTPDNLPSHDRLPNRRPQLTYELAWQQAPDLPPIGLTVSVGFDRQGRAREVFVTGLKVGAPLAGMRFTHIGPMNCDRVFRRSQPSYRTIVSPEGACIAKGEYAHA